MSEKNGFRAEKLHFWPENLHFYFPHIVEVYVNNDIVALYK